MDFATRRIDRGIPPITSALNDLAAIPAATAGNTGLVIAIVALLLAVPCCGGLALVGAAFFSYRAVEQPWQRRPVIVQPAPPQRAPVAVPLAAPDPPPVIAPGESGSEEAPEPAIE